MSSKRAPLCRVNATYRVCAACDEPKTSNVRYSFAGGCVRCICEDCHRLGFVLDAAGVVVYRPERVTA